MRLIRVAPIACAFALMCLGSVASLMAAEEAKDPLKASPEAVAKC